MSKVFEDTPKTDTTPKKWAEDLYSYLSRSASPPSETGRRLIEDWLSRVPADEQTSLRLRLQSGRDKDFNSAFQELFLLELLTCLDCKLSSHPSVEGTTKRPDFEVQQPNGSKFLLEARSLAPVLSGHDSSAQGVLAFDVLDGLNLHGYSLRIDELVAGTKNLKQNRLARHVKEALANTTVISAGPVSIPLFATQDGWRIKLTAIPALNWQPTDGRVCSVALSRTRSDPSHSLLAALNRKGTRYGEGAIPYVIAVNSLEPFLEETAFSDALFGALPQTPMPDTTSKDRISGFWGTAGSPKHQRVSAVLFTANLWYLALLRGEVRTRLYLNPWAHRSYEGVLTKLCAVRLEGGALNRYPGTRVHELLQLKTTRMLSVDQPPTRCHPSS